MQVLIAQERGGEFPLSREVLEELLESFAEGPVPVVIDFAMDDPPIGWATGLTLDRLPNGYELWAELVAGSPPRQYIGVRWRTASCGFWANRHHPVTGEAQPARLAFVTLLTL